MLKIQKIKSENNLAFYKYFPEGKEHFGIISINEKTGEVKSVQALGDEFGSSYLMHAVSCVLNYFNQHNFLDSDVVIWN